MQNYQWHQKYHHPSVKKNLVFYDTILCMCTEMHQSGIGVREKGKGYGQKKRNAYKVDNQEQ